MEGNSLLQNIDFFNEKHRSQTRKIIEEKLQQLMSNSHNISNIHEKLLVSAQKQVMPFINEILDCKSFCEFSDLKMAVDYIVTCQRENRKLPFPEIENYVELCYNTAFIFDTNMEDECHENKIEKYCCLRDLYYTEISQKDPKIQIVAEYFWSPIFSGYYNFLGYFNAESDDIERDRNICKDLIMDILFEVLWDLDNECEHTIEDSFFKRAVTSLFDCEE